MIKYSTNNTDFIGSQSQFIPCIETMGIDQSTGENEVQCTRSGWPPSKMCNLRLGEIDYSHIFRWVHRYDALDWLLGCQQPIRSVIPIDPSINMTSGIAP